MSEQTKKTIEFNAYVVRERQNADAIWRQVGVAFATQNGGYTLLLDAIPLDGKLVLQRPKAPQQ